MTESKIEITPSPELAETKKDITVRDYIANLVDNIMNIKGVSIAFKNNATGRWDSYKITTSSLKITSILIIEDAKNNRYAFYYDYIDPWTYNWEQVTDNGKSLVDYFDKLNTNKIAVTKIKLFF
jgi:formylmethanofuran dehydrogenase subunit A